MFAIYSIAFCGNLILCLQCTCIHSTVHAINYVVILFYVDVIIVVVLHVLSLLEPFVVNIFLCVCMLLVFLLITLPCVLSLLSSLYFLSFVVLRVKVLIGVIQSSIYPFTTLFK